MITIGNRLKIKTIISLSYNITSNLNNMTVYKLITILIILIPQCSTLFRASYNKMLNKAKNYYKSYNTNKTRNFMGHDISQYPGTNPTYLKINQQKWEEYYACLNLQNINVGQDNTINPEAVVGFEGSMVSFDCKICLNPEERENIEAVEWFWAPLGTSHLSTIDYTEHILLSPEDKTLSLYNLIESQTGQYMCILGNSLTAPYFLTVMNSNANISEVHSPLAKYGPYPQEPYQIFRYNLVLDTVWSSWSHCSTCGSAGKRHKLGYCAIYVLEQKREALTSLHSFENNQLQVTQEDLDFLNVFTSGIPCLSHILPESIKNLPEVRNRTSEIMVGYCKEACQKNVIFEVKDKNGKVIETANNSAGIYSTLQQIPPVQPRVSRLLNYEIAGKRIILTCPGNLNLDTPVKWQIGPKTVIPELLAKQSNRRIIITVMDKININNAKISDSNIYSCWQNNELAGTIRLIVEKKLKMSFNHHVMLVGMIVILSVFVYVFARAFLGRKYARI